MLISSIDYPLSFPLGIIVGINGVALTPINEKTMIERHEHYN